MSLGNSVPSRPSPPVALSPPWGYHLAAVNMTKAENGDKESHLEGESPRKVSASGTFSMAGNRSN